MTLLAIIQGFNDLRKHWRWLAMAAMAAGWLYTAHALQAERAAHLATHAAHAEQRQVATAAALANERRIRELEQELTDATDTHAQTQRELAAERAARAADARAFDGRLRHAASAIADRADKAAAAAAAAGHQPPDGPDTRMLAFVFGRADARARELAATADDNRARGLACEHDYNRARETLKQLLQTACR